MASAAYERRNARARALGYTSYYDYRAHGNGALPPSAPRLKGDELRRARGHAGAADIVKDVRPGQLVTAAPDPTSRRKDGTYSRVILTLVGLNAGEPDREYLIRDATPAKMAKLTADLLAAGAVFSPSPSLDIAGAMGPEEDPDEEEFDPEDYDDDDDGIPF